MLAGSSSFDSIPNTIRYWVFATYLFQDLRWLDVAEAPAVSTFSRFVVRRSAVPLGINSVSTLTPLTSAPPFPSVVLYLASNMLALSGSCSGFPASRYQEL